MEEMKKYTHRAKPPVLGKEFTDEHMKDLKQVLSKRMKTYAGSFRLLPALSLACVFKMCGVCLCAVSCMSIS
jgi:hypothetical protein